MKRVLVIAAHPDDELLGCGGTLLRHAKKGDAVFVLLCCEATSMRKEAEHQEAYMQHAMCALHVQKLFCLSMEDQRLDGFPLIDLVKGIEEVMETIKPQVVYTHFHGDNNQDHRRVFEATMIAARPLDESLEAVYAFYTPSATEWGRTQGFTPDTWVDISQEMEEKIAAFACYPSEVRPYPHPRSVEGLRHMNAFFGNQCLMAYAEPFQTVMRTVRREKQLP